MYWVIQNNIYEEENYKHLIETVERFNIPYCTVKAVPFSGGIIDPQPVIPAGMDVIVMGSYSLARHARERGWRPGAFIENLDFEIQVKHWGDHMLNADAKIYPWGDIPFQYEPFFIRPTLDTKTYTGLVVDWGEYERWRDSLRRLPETNDPVNDPLSISVHTINEPTMVCKKKEIYSETRTWVIDSKVVTCSGYKLGQTIKRYTSPDQVDQRIVDFANARAQEWSPNRAYVLDVAETADGLKIGEVNNLNSAGWYRCDMQKLITSLEYMDRKVPRY